MYYVIFNNLEQRSLFIEHLKKSGISCVFHYIPLHSSPAGKKFGRYVGDMGVTNRISDTLVRLPLHYSIDTNAQTKIFDVIDSFFKG